jgi:hypothetical protein
MWTHLMVITTATRTVVLMHNDGCGTLAEDYKSALEKSLDDGGEMPTKKRKPGSGRKRTTEVFPTLLPTLQAFVDSQSSYAQDRRRDSTARLIAPSGGEVEGFRMADAQFNLFQNVPRLYEYGLNERTLHRLFMAPRKKTVAAGSYRGEIDARLNIREEREHEGG